MKNQIKAYWLNFWDFLMASSFLTEPSICFVLWIRSSACGSVSNVVVLFFVRAVSYPFGPEDYWQQDGSLAIVKILFFLRTGSKVFSGYYICYLILGLYFSTLYLIYSLWEHLLACTLSSLSSLIFIMNSSMKEGFA
jgi:hypothetical protein